MTAFAQSAKKPAAAPSAASAQGARSFWDEAPLLAVEEALLPLAVPLAVLETVPVALILALPTLTEELEPDEPPEVWLAFMAGPVMAAAVTPVLFMQSLL